MLSIITATYNSEQYILNLINSLNKQNIKLFEWIIIDGCSTDKTIDIIKLNFIGKLHVISEIDQGIYHAINKGILMANFKYYIVIGSDDCFYDGAIEHLVNIINKSPSIDFITGKVVDMSNKYYIPMGKDVYRYGQRAYISNHSVGLVIKKDLHALIGLYSLKYKLCSDQLFLLNSIKCGAKIKYTDYLIGMYSGEGISSTDKMRWIIEFYLVLIDTNKNKVFQSTLLLIYRIVRYLFSK
jgi:glycosyltransferase involved in cell wall biosynthesis